MEAISKGHICYLTPLPFVKRRPCLSHLFALYCMLQLGGFILFQHDANMPSSPGQGPPDHEKYRVQVLAHLTEAARCSCSGSSTPSSSMKALSAAVAASSGSSATSGARPTVSQG